MGTPRARRRRLVTAIAMALLCAVASAQGSRGGAGQGGSGAGHPPGGSGASTSPPASEVSPASPARPGDGVPDHTLVASLRFAAGGALLIDGGALEAESPWSRFLAPGMWVELRGSWQGETFHARTLSVTRPAYFSYYLGPAAALGLGDGWVEAWYATDRAGAPAVRLALRRTARADAPAALARAVDGVWAAVPAGLAVPPPDRDGWTLLTGRADGDAVRWTASRPFP